MFHKHSIHFIWFDSTRY